MNYCPQCGGRVSGRIPPDDDRSRFVCDDCGTIHYHNPKVVVGCIPEWQDQILLCLRNIEPRRNCWTLPAGYLENGETALAGAQRETLEETHGLVEYLEPYLLLDIPHISQIYLLFRGQLRSGDFSPTKESREVRLFSKEKIPWDLIAFPVISEALKQYCHDQPTGKFPFRNLVIDNHSPLA